MTPTIIGKASIYNVDCMEYMATLPDKAFDLAIVDPPYRDASDNQPTKTMRQKAGGSMRNFGDKPDSEYFKELFRVSKNQIIWGGNYFPLPPSIGIVFWDKVQPWPNFSAGELAWTSFECVTRMFRFDNRTGDKIHPTQKPVALYEWLLANYAKPGQRILDTHMGSGSSVIAADNLGFEIVATELDQDYFNAACKRIEQATAQERLFA
jgi:site-specific DNA-methyltransferase (adenine-specific)